MRLPVNEYQRANNPADILALHQYSDDRTWTRVWSTCQYAVSWRVWFGASVRCTGLGGLVLWAQTEGTQSRVWRESRHLLFSLARYVIGWLQSRGFMAPCCFLKTSKRLVFSCHFGQINSKKCRIAWPSDVKTRDSQGVPMHRFPWDTGRRMWWTEWVSRSPKNDW